jgi:uncharacterized protein (TIGR02145 family)
MNKLFAVTQLVLCLVFVFCNNYGGKSRPSELVGQWERASWSGSIYYRPKNLELFKDGTGVVDGGTVSWKVENKRLVILSSSKGLACNYKVSGYELALAYDDRDSAIFVRKGELEEFKAKREAGKAKKIADTKRAIEQLPKFTDRRDNKVYRKVTIVSQTWMAENLNYAADKSVCYEDSAENCEKYGRLYTGYEAIKACPIGWHLPTDNEWTTLIDFVGGEDIAGWKLKSTEGWDEDGNGTDEYLFSALSGGTGRSDYETDTHYFDIGSSGHWWSATGDVTHAWHLTMSYGDGKAIGMGDFGNKNELKSVRCVQD